MRRKLLISLFIITFLVSACSAVDVARQAQDRDFILLASTIGPIDAGVVGALEDGFEKDTGIRVRHVGAGTGAALKMAEAVCSLLVDDQVRLMMIERGRMQAENFTWQESAKKALEVFKSLA